MSMIIPNLEGLVPVERHYRRLLKLINFMDKDRWFSSVRMLFERVFAHQSKRARYRGIRKTQFQAFVQALAFNLSRLLRINSPPILLPSF